MSLANTLVYNEGLQCGSDEVAMGRLHLPLFPSLSTQGGNLMERVLDPQLPVLFLDTDGCSDAREDIIGEQICNKWEAHLTAKLVTKLIKVFSAFLDMIPPALNIQVVAPDC